MFNRVEKNLISNLIDRIFYDKKRDIYRWRRERLLHMTQGLIMRFNNTVCARSLRFLIIAKTSQCKPVLAAPVYEYLIIIQHKQTEITFDFFYVLNLL